MVDLWGYCMAMAQYTRDWDARFRLGDTPWEDQVVAPTSIELIREYAPVHSTVLEIGCGGGTTAIWLAEQGYRVVACDISPEAVRQARQRASTVIYWCASPSVVAASRSKCRHDLRLPTSLVSVAAPRARRLACQLDSPSSKCRFAGCGY